MSFDPVPWLVAGGAQHSAEVGRVLAYAAMGGKEGIIGPESLKVTAQASPAGSVRVDTGAVAIENTYAGQESQMYVARNISSQNVNVGATGGTARSDLIIARIDDPQYGGSTPVDPAVGPYVKFDIITNVGSSETDIPSGITYPAIALARVDVPASTSAITDAMITDLRGVRGVAGSAGYRKESITYTPAAEIDLDAAAPGEAWPKTDGWNIEVPDWATKMSVKATIGGVRVDNQTSKANYGKIWVTFGSVTTPTTKYEHSEGGVNASQNRIIVLGGASGISIPSAMRGSSQNLKVMGQRDGSPAGTNHLKADTTTTVFLDVEFFEEPA